MSSRVAVACLPIVMCAVSAFPQQSSGELPQLPETGVVVPWEDFKKILDEIRRPQPTPVIPPPPVDFALSECSATAIVGSDEEQLRVALSFQVQVLNDQRWVEIPVIGEGVALASVRMDGAPARLYRRNGFQTLALRGAGQHRLTLEYLLPVTVSRGTRTARLRFPQSPVVSIDLRIPRSEVDVQVDGAVVQALSRTARETRVRAALGRIGDTSVSWFPRVSTDDKVSKVFGELASLVSIGEGVLRGTTSASYSIHGRGVDSFALEIPANLTVLDVNVHGLRQWQVVDLEGESERQLLVVELNYLAQGALSFSFEFEQQMGGASAEFELPDIAIRDVLRERGFLAVAAATNVEITPREGIKNAAPVDPAELPGVLSAGNGEAILYAFKFLRHPVVVPLKVVKHQDVAVKRTIVEAARLHSFLSREGKLVSSVRYTVKNNRKQYLELELPDGADLWGTYLEDRPVKAARRDDGVLLVPLRKTAMDTAGRLRPFTVEVVYFQDDQGLRSLGRRSFAAPILDVDVLELSWELHLPREHNYFGFRGNVHPDEAANRIVVVGGSIYNFANADEMRLLGVRQREGKTYLSDGANEALLEDVRVRSAGKKRMLSGDELAAIGDKVGAIAKDEDEETKRADKEQYEPAPAPQRQQLRGAPQVQENVAMNIAALRAAPGGRALGVLPVRIAVPSEGVRLSFTGRLLTASEPAMLSVRYAPAGWRLPKLGRFWTVVLAFVLGVILLFLIGLGFRDLTTARLAGMATTSAALVAVFAAAAGHRFAFALACAAAVGAYALLVQFKDRPDVGEGF
jgi:hypothetical protein